MARMNFRQDFVMMIASETLYQTLLLLLLLVVVVVVVVVAAAAVVVVVIVVCDDIAIINQTLFISDFIYTSKRSKKEKATIILYILYN